MSTPHAFVDCHCHILPRVDDGASSWEEALEMARLATEDGIQKVIATPHQLGAYGHITSDMICERVGQFQEALDRERIPLTVYPGAEVCFRSDLATYVQRGDIVTLADRGRHVMVQIPHDSVAFLEGLLPSFRSANMQILLSQPERNRRILRQYEMVESLVDEGFLIQVTAGALSGAFGVQIRVLAEWLVQERLVHVVASDAHASGARRPLLSRAYHRVCHLTDTAYGNEIFCRNPERILRGELIPVVARRSRRYRFAQWFRWRRAG